MVRKASYSVGWNTQEPATAAIVILKKRQPSDYQVSILEEAGTVFDFDKAEALWKHKLQTREMGTEWISRVRPNKTGLGAQH